MNKQKIIVILGPTAVGKTKLSIVLAKYLHTEIISGDSMLVYKGMDIGTAKPSIEEMAGVKHHVIDILEPWENFNVSNFQAVVKPLIEKINAQGKIPILAGGTGLYVKSLVEGYQFNKTSGDLSYRKHLEELAKEHGKEYVLDMLKKVDSQTAEKLHVNNFNRIIRALEVYHLGQEKISHASYYEQTGKLVYDVYVVGIQRERANLYARINQRVDIMMANNFIGEVQNLLAKGAEPTWQAMKGIGYREIMAYLQGEMDLNTAVEEMKKATRHFAKRQFTWYRKMPYINWYDAENMTYHELLAKVEEDCDKFFAK